MAFAYLSKIEKELYLKKQIEELRSIYERAQHSLSKKLREIDLTDFAKYRTDKILKEVQVIIKNLDEMGYKWASDTLPVSYKEGAEVAAERLKILRVIKDRPQYDAQIHISAVNILVDDLTTELLEVNGLINKEVTRFIRQTQQKLLQDKQISRMIAEGLIEGEPVRSISDKLFNEFRKHMENEQFIVIKGRRYEPKNYAELVARTRTREATTQGAINMSLQYNNDLVQVSAHAGACEVCQSFQGRVYSITGTDPEFPKLEDEPPYHPNCEHVLVPVTKEHLFRTLGVNYKNIVDLSNSQEKIESYKDYENYLYGIKSGNA